MSLAFGFGTPFYISDFQTPAEISIKRISREVITLFSILKCTADMS